MSTSFSRDLEPKAVGCTNGANSLTADQVIALSQAISLKRLADALAPAQGMGFAEHLGACLQDAIHNATQRLV